MSLELTMWNPHRRFFFRSPFSRFTGARIPAWIFEPLRGNPSSWAICKKVPWLTPLISLLAPRDSRDTDIFLPRTAGSRYLNRNTSVTGSWREDAHLPMWLSK
jgi:hypothetical protein